jgi:hypothetical protein
VAEAYGGAKTFPPPSFFQQLGKNIGEMYAGQSSIEVPASHFPTIGVDVKHLLPLSCQLHSCANLLQILIVWITQSHAA